RLSAFYFHDTSPTATYTLSLHDALPISHDDDEHDVVRGRAARVLHLRVRVPVRRTERRGARRYVAAERHLGPRARGRHRDARVRSEEHTSELQSQSNLVCRLLLEKKKL